MLLDPFTVVAQVVNFALLVWLLRRFLFGPVLRAMEAREARIREEVEEARRLRAAAEAEGERYRGLVATFEEERDARLADVRSETDALRQEQLRKTRAEVRELRERWNRALEQEKDDFLRELRARAGQGSIEVIRRALRELADDDLESRLIGRFIERLRGMEQIERERLAEAARGDGGGVRLRTAFPLSDERREKLTRSLAEVLGTGAAPRFDTDPDLLAGVELRAGGLKLAWTLDDYLGTLDEALRGAFRQTRDIGTPDDGS